MKHYRNEILLLLLAVSLIGTLIFWIPWVSTTISIQIHRDPITDKVEDIFTDPLIRLIIIPVTLANVICAVKGFYSVYKEKKPIRRRFIEYGSYLIYFIISLGALVIHWTTLVYVIEGIIAG